MDFNILSWLIWTPVLGAILIVILPKNRMDLIKWIAVCFTGIFLRPKKNSP